MKNQHSQDTSEYLDCLDSLKKVNRGIFREEILLWFNDNDIEYFYMTDLELYIYYIENNASKLQEKAFKENLAP